MPLDDSAAVHRGLRAEAALLSVLNDIADGHLGLWGEPGDIKVDRGVPVVLREFDWVNELLIRGWVVPARGPRSFLRVGPLGRAVMRAKHRY